MLYLDHLHHQRCYLVLSQYQVFHIHFHAIGDNDEILFRDYLNSHLEVAHEYEKLKLSLLPKYKHDRDGYTDAKSAFVKNILGIAKKRG